MATPHKAASFGGGRGEAPLPEVLGTEDGAEEEEAQSAQLIQDSWKFRRAKKERNAAATKYAKPLRNPAAICG